MEIVDRPARPTGVRRVLFRLPIMLYRMRLGGLLGGRFVLIHHIGRRSGKVREVIVEVARRDPATGAVTVASGFGPEADWYRNVLLNPDVDIQVGSRPMRVHAIPLPADEAAATMADYARRHPRAARSLSRYMGFVVDGGADGYRRAGRQIPMLRLEPRP